MLGYCAGWGGVRGMRPQPKMGEECLDDLALVNKGNDAHRAAASWTQRRIGRRYLLDQPRPALFERVEPGSGKISTVPQACVWGWLLCLVAFPPIDVTVPAIVPEQMFPLIWDMGCDGGDPVQHGEGLTTALEDTMHLGPVDDRAPRGLAAHLLEGEGGFGDILGQLLLPPLVSAVNAHLVMNAESGVPRA